MNRRTSLALAGTTLAGLAVAVTLGGSASAESLSPVESQADEISTAVVGSPATAGVDDADYTVTHALVSGEWASAQLEPTADPTVELDPATAVLQYVDGAWQVVDLGTAQVGCGIVPSALEGDLSLAC